MLIDMPIGLLNSGCEERQCDRKVWTWLWYI